MTRDEATTAASLAAEALHDARLYPGFAVLDPSSEAQRLVDVAFRIQRQIHVAGYRELAATIAELT